MEALTEKLWSQQNRHDGDRLRLFRAVADAVEGSRVLYPGSFVDVAASFVFDAVTYVDVDARAARFFTDTAGVADIVAANQIDDGERTIDFVAGDYRDDLGLPDDSFDLLVSLYAGFVSEHCTRHLRIGGHLLVNPSHGDAAMASIDERYRLAGIITSSAGRYRLRTEQLDTYLIPKTPQPVTVEILHERGKGIGYTRSPFAYLFQRVT